jgi:hypothetical protein
MRSTSPEPRGPWLTFSALYNAKRATRLSATLQASRGSVVPAFEHLFQPQELFAIRPIFLRRDFVFPMRKDQLCELGRLPTRREVVPLRSARVRVIARHDSRAHGLQTDKRDALCRGPVRPARPRRRVTSSPPLNAFPALSQPPLREQPELPSRERPALLERKPG